MEERKKKEKESFEVIGWPLASFDCLLGRFVGRKRRQQVVEERKEERERARDRDGSLSAGVSLSIGK